MATKLANRTTVERHPARTPPRTGKTAVVVLCADEATRDVIAYWSQALSADAVIADDGYQARRALNRAQAVTLVTDRVFPPWPGLDVITNLRSRNPELRIAYVDNGSVDDRILARITGADVVLSQPLTRQAVAAALSPQEP